MTGQASSMQPVWAPRLARWTRGLTLFAVVLAVAALTLGRYDLIPKLFGFGGFAIGGLIALIAVLFGVAAAIAGWRSKAPPSRGTWIALLVALGFAGFILSRPLAARGIPPIHDVSTDVANPPAFQSLTLRADNLAGVETVENWQRLHRAAYGHIQPLTLARPVAEVTADAVSLAEERGWKIVAQDLPRGRLEATAAVSYIRFYDDVVLRITPTADGAGSRVDMRSVSQIGVSDFGVNARRVEDFLKDLAAK